LKSEYGKVPLTEIMNTGLFDYERTSQSAGWIAELEREHTPETEEYGISSFVFRDQRPFHPERFWNFLSQNWSFSVIRSKGLFWLATRPDSALSWSQAGGSLKAEPAGVWWASMPEHERIVHPAYIENHRLIKSRWSEEFGDRMNELVMIGQDMDVKEITEELEACLCTPEEYAQASLLADPFPQWQTTEV
jgi:G3E family GTPase